MTTESTTSLSRLQTELAELLNHHRLHYPDLAVQGEPLQVHCACGWTYAGDNSLECGDRWSRHVAVLWLPVYNERELRILGAVHVDEEANNRNLNDFLADQRKHYAAVDKDTLVEEMLRRDRNAVIQGRQLTDGRMANRMLRELTRHLLRMADEGELRQLESGLRTDRKGMTIDNILGMLGAEPADRRLLAESGTTLRAKSTEEELRLDFEKPGGPTVDASTPQARPDIAESIRQRRKEQVPEPAKPDPGTMPGLGD